MTVYPLAALRSVALRTQGLDAPNGAGPRPRGEDLYRSVAQIGCVQIDTLHMVRRSQYLVLWSRLGSYDPAELDALASAADRRLFEGWQHAACLIPLVEYRYQIPDQRQAREQPSSQSRLWLSRPENAALIGSVMERIRREGALRTSDFEGDGRKRNSWWDWKPAKYALEHLYAWGDLMIAGRRNFQRLYDLTERVLPDWVDTSEPVRNERDRFWVERGARTLGVCTPRQAGDYTWMKVTHSRPAVESLLKEGVLIPITGRLAGGNTGELLIHRDNLALLEQAADGALQAGCTTFLSPFDSLFWAGGRDEQLWGFRKTIEAYVPAPKRVYGYFCLPILHRDRLVGRFDPKLDRKADKLILRALYLEPGIKPDEGLVGAVAGAMRDFMAFHAAKELVVERSQPATFGKKLIAAL
jgi:uncharacterized protein YcaQ